jgi:hypothetical protein
MPGDTKEPQSYGSQGDWSSGDVGETVNRQKGAPNSQHADFYESRREEENHPPQGGSVSPVQMADNQSADVVQHGTDDEPAWKVTSAETGAKRDGYFKERDYK